MRPVHPEKAASPIVMTELGMVIDTSPAHPEKAPSPILVIESGIVNDASFLYFSDLLKTVLELVVFRISFSFGRHIDSSMILIYTCLRYDQI